MCNPLILNILYNINILKIDIPYFNIFSSDQNVQKETLYSLFRHIYTEEMFLDITMLRITI